MKVARFVLKIVALSLKRGRLLCKEERRVRSNRFLLVFLFASTCLQTEIKRWINFLVFCLVSF